MTKIYWITTDNNEVAQKIISKNNLPKSLTDVEFKARLIKDKVPRFEDDDDIVYNLKKKLTFSAELRTFMTSENEDVTIISICQEDKFMFERNIYLPDNYPGMFCFLTTFAFAVFGSGNSIVLRNPRNHVLDLAL